MQQLWAKSIKIVQVSFFDWQGGDMFHYVRRRGGLAEDEARWFFQQVILALEYAHEIGVSIRDIKLENTLIDRSKRPQVKLCDFGYSKNDKDSLPKSKVGTPGYTGTAVTFPLLTGTSGAVAAYSVLMQMSVLS